MKSLRKSLVPFMLLFFAFACERMDDGGNLNPVDDSPVFMDLPQLRESAAGRSAADRHYTISSAEYLTAGENGKIGRTVFFNDVGNKQLGEDFVPGTSLDGTDDISYYIDENRPTNDMDVAVSSQAISRAMTTWDQVTCSDLGLNRIPSEKEIGTGLVSAVFGFGGSFDYVADVVHAGWMPAEFFDMVAEDGSTFILGVTFTIVFTDDNNQPTDIDNNGKQDVAWREVYFNDAFNWADGATYDVETVALHESGHALSQGHFGKAFLDNGTNKLHFSPRAVMNAAYSGIQTQLEKGDNAGHCSIWSSWPNK
jgi:hypothetical protein